MKEPEKELTINGHKYVLAETEKAPEPTWDSINDWWQEKYTDTWHILHRQHEACIKLAITAKYLNGDSDYLCFALGLYEDQEIGAYETHDKSGMVLFSLPETAEKAVKILGEDVVRDALMFGA